MTVSFQSGHDGASVNLDVLDLLNTIHEVSRHALSQIGRACDDMDAPRDSRESHYRLSSRIAGANDDDLLVATEFRFRVRSGIVDARTLELAQTGHLEPAILHTRRDQDRLAANLRAVGECDDANAGVGTETLDHPWHADSRTEFLRLKLRVAHEFGAGYAQWKA